MLAKLTCRGVPPAQMAYPPATTARPLSPGSDGVEKLDTLAPSTPHPARATEGSDRVHARTPAAILNLMDSPQLLECGAEAVARGPMNLGDNRSIKSLSPSQASEIAIAARVADRPRELVPERFRLYPAPRISAHTSGHSEDRGIPWPWFALASRFSRSFSVSCSPRPCLQIRKRSRSALA